ncbi:hypothetical protein CEXT_633031 [Caerostris extrusa]|uniref:LAGLIDADG homing endonuclease n=1 Tax=Caerostris extrusa TaxID=172846 RepID=A0AAV4MWY9_CAEEX|nr:hypothetical protein CEXT_633031 [Caerostris extrusa]
MTKEIGFQSKILAAISSKTYPLLKAELRKKENGKFYSVTKQLLGKSSIYAVSQLGNSHNPFRKLIWMLILTMGLAASFIKCIDSENCICNIQCR